MVIFSLLNIIGSVVLLFMMLFYILEQRSNSYTLAFGFACLGASAYGWIAGTWPFGIIELAWGAFAFNKWSKKRKVKETR
jgi:hypothetical protein